MENVGKKSAKLRLLKRIGLIGLFTSGAIGLVFLILSFLPQGNAAFTISIDNPSTSKNSNFHMFVNVTDAEDGDPKQATTYISSDPIKEVGLTEAKKIENHLSTLRASNSLNGSTNYKNESGKNLALVHSVYLSNTADEPITVGYAVRLDAYKDPANGLTSPIEYFRVLVQTEITDDSTSLNNVYYGQKRSQIDDLSYVFDDEREVISEMKTYLGEDGKKHATVADDWSSPGNDGYCVSFRDYEEYKDIVLSEINIPVGKTMRYTFVAYFEGNDVDSYNRVVSDSYLLLSLHFGI